MQILDETQSISNLCYNYFMKSTYKFGLLVFLVLIFAVTLRAANAENYPKPYQSYVMDEINKVREQGGLDALAVDPKLCVLAEKFTMDNERSYPNELNSSLFSNDNYKDYLEGYSDYDSSLGTTQDMLVKLQKVQGTIESFNNNNILSRYISEDGEVYDTVILNADITHACVGGSDGKTGYKAFTYFIGGVEEDTSFFGKIWNFLSVWFQGN